MRSLAFSLLAVAAIAAPAPSKGPFDPGQDAAKDLAKAKVLARKTGRRILMDVGGNWCPWCVRLHGFWEEHADLKALRDKHFVFVMVNFSPENKNEKLLSRYPRIPGYPHFFVLDAKGKLVQSQDTSALEEGKGYSPDKVREFLTAWKP
jgi:thioredoxin-related protein